ncbi:hypothetical protein OFB80_34480, partial [Escherichia coli]|nr:hypothetical protein [Escherichia coli]
YRKPCAAFADMCLKTAFQPLDKAVGANLAGSPPDAVSGYIVIAKPNIFLNCAAEQKNILKNNRKVLPEAFQIPFADINT